MKSGPLASYRVRVGNWPSAQLAGHLLAGLGAEVASTAAEPGVALSAVGRQVRAASTTAAQDWVAAGVAELTGRPHGATLDPDGMPASYARACGFVIDLLAPGGIPIASDGGLEQELGARVAELNLRRGGDQSANGSCRLLPTADGWCALSIARPSDLDLLPALIGAQVTGATAVEVWPQVTEWARSMPSRAVEERGELLGLPVGRVPDRALVDGRGTGDPPWQITRGTSTGRNRRGGPLRVVNLGSLWAAPLCAQLLARAGAEVIDVESPGRPDGAREATPDFYARLHAGQVRRVLDLPTAGGRAALAALLQRADVVITGSRSSALQRLGATPAAVASPRDQIWVSITGHGRLSPRVGFGDDAAAAAGLLAWDDAGPVFVADAIADPLAGLSAAVAVFAGLTAGGSWHIDSSLRAAAAAAGSS